MRERVKSILKKIKFIKECIKNNFEYYFEIFKYCVLSIFALDLTASHLRIVTHEENNIFTVELYGWEDQFFYLYLITFPFKLYIMFSLFLILDKLVVLDLIMISMFLYVSCYAVFSALIMIDCFIKLYVDEEGLSRVFIGKSPDFGLNICFFLFIVKIFFTGENVSSIMYI